MAPEAKGKKRETANLTLEQKLTLIHGRTDGRLESLKEINWKLGQYLEDRVNAPPDVQRLMELKKIGVIVAIQEMELSGKRREIERGKVPRPMRKKDLPNEFADLKDLYRDISKRYREYQSDLVPIADRLKKVLSVEIMSEAKDLWHTSKTHAVTLKELNELDESSDLRAINDEEKKLIDLLLGREEEKPIVKKAEPKARRKEPVEVPPPNLKPFRMLIFGGIAGVALGAVLWVLVAAMSMDVMGLIMLIAPAGAGAGLMAVGAMRIRKANEDYAAAKRRAEAEAVEEVPAAAPERAAESAEGA